MLKKALASLVCLTVLAVSAEAAENAKDKQTLNSSVGQQVQMPNDVRQRLAQQMKNKQHTVQYQEREIPLQDKNAKKVSKKDKNNKPITEKRVYYADVLLPRDYKEISIFGNSEATMGQAAAYIRRNAPNVKLDCSIEELVELYWREAALEGVRGDLTLCQAITETGFFRYGGDVSHHQNNFCGLGTTGGGVRGAGFSTPQIGVRAHIQHLLAYSRKSRPLTKVVDPRYDLAHKIRVERGLVDKWSGLTGTWAMSKDYCEKIMSHYVRMTAITGVPATFDTRLKPNGERKSMRERMKKMRNK